MATHNDLGKDGEIIAFRYLQKHGYSVLAQNWYHYKKEIDIVATDGQWLVIVEVKTRRISSTIPPIEAVTRTKRRNLCIAANAYIHQFNIKMPIRFDVVSVLYDPTSNTYEVNHIKRAFLPELQRPRSKRY